MLFPLRISVLALLLASPLAVVAQPAPQPSTDAQQKAPRPERGPDAREGRRLPPDVTTEHELQLPGRTLKFAATAGSLPLVDPAGNVQAEIGYVAYRLAGAESGPEPARHIRRESEQRYRARLGDFAAILGLSHLLDRLASPDIRSLR